MADLDRQVAIRISADLAERVERLQQRLARDPLMARVKTAEVYRLALEAGVAALERKHSKRRG